MKKLLLTTLMASSSLAFAHDFKLGYVNVAKIFTASKPAVAVKAALKSKYSSDRNKLQAMNNQLMHEQQTKAMRKIIMKAEHGKKLTRKEREKLNNFRSQEINFQRKYMTFERSLQKAQDFATIKVLKQTNEIVRGISDKGNYDLVVTSNQLVYAKPKYDLTDQVIAKLNKMDTAQLVNQVQHIENQPAVMHPANGIKAPVSVNTSAANAQPKSSS